MIGANPNPIFFRTPQSPYSFNRLHIGITIKPENKDIVHQLTTKAKLLAGSFRDPMHSDDPSRLTCHFCDRKFRQNAPWIASTSGGLILAYKVAASLFGLS